MNEVVTQRLYQNCYFPTKQNIPYPGETRLRRIISARDPAALSERTFSTMEDQTRNPQDADHSLKRPLEGEQLEQAKSERGSAEIKIEKTESSSIQCESVAPEPEGPASKRLKLEEPEKALKVDARDKVKGIALIKPE